MEVEEEIEEPEEIEPPPAVVLFSGLLACANGHDWILCEDCSSAGTRFPSRRIVS